MNGEDKQFLNKLENKIITLETLTVERWQAHNKRADENSDRTCKKFDILFDKIDGITKQLTKQTNNCRGEWQSYVNKVVGWTLGIPFTISLILGIILFFLKL